MYYGTRYEAGYQRTEGHELFKTGVFSVNLDQQSPYSASQLSCSGCAVAIQKKLLHVHIQNDMRNVPCSCWKNWKDSNYPSCFICVSISLICSSV